MRLLRLRTRQALLRLGGRAVRRGGGGRGGGSGTRREVAVLQRVRVLRACIRLLHQLLRVDVHVRTLVLIGGSAQLRAGRSLLKARRLRALP